METPRETIADMLVEFPAVFRQIGIVRCARDGDAGIETDDVQAAKLVLQGEAKSLAETSGVCFLFDVDGAFRRPSVSGARVERMSTDERARVEERLGLHDSVAVQYARWLERAAAGDFGISYKYKMPALEVIESRLENTLILGGLGFLLIFGGAVLLGLFCAWHEGRWTDRLICQAGTVTSAIPEFWLALVLILIFAVELRLLPSSGAYSLDGDSIADRLLHLILPMTVVVINHLWYYAYMIRNKILEEVREDYILLAKAKGLSRKRILLRHALPNVLPSYFSLMAISVPHILGGTYVVEAVFSYPGLGTLSYESARFQDYNLLMLLCLLSGAVVILSSLIAQAVNEAIDPRMKSAAAPEDAEVIRL